MDDITKKKINECVKRALIYNSGRKMKLPKSFCFLNNAEIENQCSGNINPDRLPGEQSAVEASRLDSCCFGCAFYKSFFYISDLIAFYKDSIALSLQSSSPFLKSQYGTMINKTKALFEEILSLTRTSCYLTFNTNLYNSAVKELSMLTPDKYYEMLTKIYDFCKENNIK